MELHLERVTTPRVFFNHELDNLRAEENYSRSNFFLHSLTKMENI